jgi:catechol 2,3-dioxygenase-like lactoylglutathione lyase family enzyme
MSALAELVIGGDIEPWLALGLVAWDDRSIAVGQVRLRFESDEPSGLRSLGIAGGPDPLSTALDGAAIHVAEPLDASGPLGSLGCTGIDHVVVSTPDLARTTAAITAGLGVEPRRTRTEPTGSGDRLHQVFYRLGPVILEVVGPPAPDPARAAEPARLWGLVLLVADLDAASALLGPDRLGPAKPAVQPGRSIATVRTAAGLGVPVALLTSPR